MENTHPRWNFQEFSTYLLILAAWADNKITGEEEAMIVKKVGEDTYQVILREFEELFEKERLELILSYKGLYFPTAARTNELLSMVMKEFWADGEFSELEQNLYRTLKQLM